jgi:hypothetical protein
MYVADVPRHQFNSCIETSLCVHVCYIRSCMHRLFSGMRSCARGMECANSFRCNKHTCNACIARTAHDGALAARTRKAEARVHFPGYSIVNDLFAQSFCEDVGLRGETLCVSVCVCDGTRWRTQGRVQSRMMTWRQHCFMFHLSVMHTADVLGRKAGFGG